MMKPLSLLSALLLFFMLAGCGQKPLYDSPEYTVLEDITIIDGRANPPVSGRYIVMNDSLIIHVGNMQEKLYGKSANIVNLSGKFVLPGYIDTHAHVTVLKTTPGETNTDVIDTAVSLQSLQTLLSFGITAVRNPAGPEHAAVWLRNMVKNGNAIGPDIVTTGRALNSFGGGPFVKVVSESDVEKEIDVQHLSGVDMIKVYGSLQPTLIKKAIEYAHTKGLKVIGHLQRTSWSQGAVYGIDFLTHAASWSPEYIPEDLHANYRGSITDRITWLKHIDLNAGPVPEMFQLLKQNSVIVDPTLIALHTKFWGNDSIYLQSSWNKYAEPSILNNWRKGSFVDDWSSEDFRTAQEQWPKLREYIYKMYSAGVLLAAGSDFPNPWVVPGISLHQELKFLNECGIPPLEVIKIATYNGAMALGMQHITGSVEVNKQANLVVLQKNPAEDILHTQSIFAVYKNGKPAVRHK